MTLNQLQKLFPDATADTWHQHPNGGGWVQNNCTVGMNVFVNDTAQIYDNSVVDNFVQVLGRGQIFQFADVGDNVIVADRAKFFGHAVGRGSGQVIAYARVSGPSALISGGIISGHAQVDNSTVADDAIVTDDVQVFSGCVIQGHAQISENAVLNGFSGTLTVQDTAQIKGCSVVSGPATISGTTVIDDPCH